MKPGKQTTIFIAGAMLLAVTLPVQADPTTQPSTQPSVASVLANMDAAYAKLQSARFDGHITGRFDAAGQQTNQDVSFTSSFAAPNHFRHEIQSQILLGSDGKKVFSYLTGRDEYQNADVPRARVASSNWPASVERILQDQNPSLLLAMSKSAADELNELSDKISLLPDTTLDGISYQTLRFDDAAEQPITMLVDPSTHLLREVKTDLAKSLKEAGTAEVKTAEVTIDYTRSVPDAPVTGDAFAWTAPAGAMLVSATSVAAGDAGAGDDGVTDDMKALVGKDAPDFSLKGLDDKPVKLSDNKGNVVILDFWATWCAPCVASMPHLDQLYKDQSAAGLKVFAINQQDDKDKVVTFVAKQGWSLPVLLDGDATVGGLYKAESLPETVVIGKDGKVKQVFAGIGHEAEIASLVKHETK